MDHIVSKRVFLDDGFKHLVYVGSTILFTQACFLVWGFLQPYRYFISIVSPFGDENLRLQGAPSSPFDLQWVAIGCVVLLIAKALQSGSKIRKDNL